MNTVFHNTFSQTVLKRIKLLVFILLSISIWACTKNKAPVGTAENPIKMFFVPSVDVKVLEDNSKVIKEHLEKVTPYKYQISIPTSFIAVVEALGTKKADVAALNTFSYILANEKYQAEAKLTVVRHGLATYQGQFITKASSAIKSVADLAGKKVAFVDPSSTSGYLLPLKVLEDKNIKPSETVFAMRHDSVVSMIYQGQVDAGATFYSPEADGEIQDARRLVKTQYPDVEKQIRILALTDPIPNDPIVFRKGLPDKVKEDIVKAIVDYVKTPEGKDAFNKMYGVTDFKATSDHEYDGVRAMLKTLGKSATEMVK